VHAFVGDGKGFLGGGVCFYKYILFFPGDLAEMPAQMGCRMEDSFLWRALRASGLRSCQIRVQ